jgi:hypothetical protein
MEIIMGMWGYAAWDSDGAADWFGDLFDRTKLAKYVEKTLKREPDEETAEEIRAAAYVVIALGRVYVWPIKKLQRHLKLAIEGLEAIKELEEYQDSSELVTAIDEEIAILKSRLQPETPEGDDETNDESE